MSNPQDPDRQPSEVPAEDGPDTPDAGTDAASSESAPQPDSQATIQLTPEEVAEITDAAHPTDPDDPIVGSLLRNKWRVLGRIGAGSFGTVYKVQDVNGGWIEALKILSVDRLRGPEADNMRERFLREARIMKRLGSLSPHIVGLSTYEDDMEAGLIYFLMEHVEGRVLSDVLLEEGPLSVERTIRIGLQVCDALIAAHEGEDPVVHRDLKLENLMLTTDRDDKESIKVLDFGIAKIAERETDSRLTQAGTLGTPGYAAPEQLRAGDVDGRTDLFAFGVILYSLVTGRNPWLGHLAYQPTNQTYELMAASDRAEVRPISESGIDVPQGMVDIIMKLLQREPGDRFQSARELHAALLALGRNMGGGRLNLTREFTPLSETGSNEPERRLAAVWFADLVGYSTLSSQDEEAALALLDTFHKTARRVIEGGGGRVVQFIGDAAFAEFSSTQRAVKTAVDFLEAFTQDTSESPFSPQLRIGVHVGDVLLAADGDLFGDGVNVAARIQNEADPGQILVSQDVWRQLKQRRDFGFVSIGERSLKGIGAPVSLFAVVEAGDVATTGDLAGRDPTTNLPTYPSGHAQAGAKGGRGKFAAAAVIAILAVGGGAYALTAFGGAESGPTGATAGSVEPPSNPAPTVPDSETLVAQAGGDGPAGGDPAATPPASGQDPAGGGDPGAGTTTTADPVTATTPPPPPPAATDDGRDAYDVLLTTVTASRNSARSNPHPLAQPRLNVAEASWADAQGEANAGRYQAALPHLRAAASIYDEVIAASTSLREIGQVENRISRLRTSATNDGLRGQAEELERQANAAVEEGRYEDALMLLGRAEFAMEQADVPVVTTPDPVEPEVVPAEVVADVLVRLKAAMESLDIDRVRGVWTSISSEQANGLSATFDLADEMTVTYTVRGPVTERGARVLATVQTVYQVGSDDPFPAFTQVFEIAESGSDWIIVESRIQGD